MTESTECARKLNRYGDLARDHVRQNLSTAETLDQSAIWGLVRIQMGMPIKAVLLKTLHNGDASQRQLADCMVLTAEGTGVLIEEPEEVSDDD